MSAGANVKVSANSSTYQQALKAARDSTKELASQFSLASTQAKLFGSTTDQLKAKQQELTAKIKAQKEITSLHHTEVERLTKVLSDQKGRQQELATQLQTTKAAYEAEKGHGREQRQHPGAGKTGERPGKPTEKLTARSAVPRASSKRLR